MNNNKLIFLTELILRSFFEYPVYYNKNDVILASFPKSGNTWLRFIVSNILACHSNFENGEVNFHTIQSYSPEIRGNRHLDGIVRTVGCPTFLKTHFGYIRGFSEYRTVVIYRNPENVMLSYKHYLENEKKRIVGDMDKFIRNWRYGIDAWCNFHRTWLNKPGTLFIKYEDLLEDTINLVSIMYKKLDCKIDKKIIDLAVQNSSKKNMSFSLSIKGDPNAKNKSYYFIRTDINGSRGTLTEYQRLYIFERSVNIMDSLDNKRIKVK